MKAYSFLKLLFAGFTAFATLGAAEKQKRTDITDYPFWTAKKRGYVAQFVPGLNAVLELTEAQKEQMAIARNEMSNEEAVKAVRAISKTDPSVTTEQRAKARATLEAATARLRERVPMTPFKSIILVILGIAGILWVIGNRSRLKKGPIPTALCHLPMVLSVISGIIGLIDPAFSLFGRFSALAQHYSHVIYGIIMGMLICLMPYLMRLHKWGGEEQPRKEG